MPTEPWIEGWGSTDERGLPPTGWSIEGVIDSPKAALREIASLSDKLKRQAEATRHWMKLAHEAQAEVRRLQDP